MALPATDPAYLRYQYDDSEKLRIRIETHARYTVGEGDFETTLLHHLAPATGQQLLDVGCGPGDHHARLRAAGVRVTGIDLSLGMLREAGADAMQRIVDVHREAATELGYIPLESRGRTFNLDHLERVREVLPSVVRYVVDSTLVFPVAEPALRFYASNRIDLLHDRPADDSHRQRLMSLVRTKLDAIIEREGAFRVPKTWGVFVADV